MTNKTDDSETGTPAVRDQPRRGRRRTRRSRSRRRGGFISGLHEASITLLQAEVDALSHAVNSYMERNEEVRKNEGRLRLADVGSNYIDAMWDGYDRLVMVPRKVRDAYDEEVDREYDE